METTIWGLGFGGLGFRVGGLGLREPYLAFLGFRGCC